MKNSVARRVSACLAITLILTAIASCGPRSVSDPPPIEDPAPSFVADLLGSDQQVRFPEDLAGRVVILTFFSPG